MAGGMERTATIISVDVQYEAKQDWMKFVPDLFLTANVRHDWEDQITIFGSFNKTVPLDDRKSWGSAFKIAEFFECALGKRGLPVQADYGIPEEWLRDCLGRQIKMCSYPTNKLKDSGKPYWNNFDRVAQAGSADGILKKMVMDSVNKGYIKNYSDSDGSDEDFNFGENVKKKESKPEVQLDGIEL